MTNLLILMLAINMLILTLAVNKLRKELESRTTTSTEVTNISVEIDDEELAKQLVPLFEMYATPRRYFLGAKPEDFTDKDGKPTIGAWQEAMDRIWLTPATHEQNIQADVIDLITKKKKGKDNE